MKETDDNIQRRLAEGVRNSDRQAFDELFRGMYPRLVRFAFKITQDWNASCDITQDVFVMLWQQRNTVDPDRSVRALLFQSVRNRAYNYQRDRREIADPGAVEALSDEYPEDGMPFEEDTLSHDRAGADSGTDSVTESETHSGSGTTGTTGTGQHARLQKKILEWVQELPDRQREAFELSRYDGLYHHEIAGVMQVSVKTVNNHLTNALKHLRSRYESYRNASQKRK